MNKPPLDPALAALLDAAREGEPELPPEVHARLYERVLTTVAQPPPPAPEAPPGPGAPAAGSTASLWAALGVLALGAGVTLWLIRSGPPAAPPPARVLSTAASVDRAARPSPEAPATAETPTAPPPLAPATEAARPPASPASTARPVVVERARRRPRPRSAAPKPTVDDALAAERALIARAASAVQRGETTAALAAIEAHRRQFPHGRLGEERDALWVHARHRAGQVGAARAAASVFLRRWPHSVHRAGVEALLGPPVAGTQGFPDGSTGGAPMP